MKMFYCPKCDKLEINFKFKNLNEEDERDTDLKDHPAIEIGIKGTF